MQVFDIAGILIGISPDKSYKLNIFNRFISSSNRKPDLMISLSGCESVCKPEGEFLIDEEIKWLYKADSDKRLFNVYKEENGAVTSILEVDDAWSEARITYLSNDSYGKSALARHLGEILLRNRILFHQGIVIHASAIEWKGKGIMFSAPSETGKSTQANLWKEHKGAVILNGDRPAVRVPDGQAFVYGTPWTGSSPGFVNKSAPLNAIVLLEQASENDMVRLTRREAVAGLTPRCFLPYYDPKLMNTAINNLEKLIESTPVYLLKCRPDKEAVELVSRCIV